MCFACLLPALVFARELAPGASPALEAGEGLLLVAADSDVDIAVLRLATVGSGARTVDALEDAPAGVTMRLLTLPAGRYAWRTLAVRDGLRYGFDAGADAGFEVVAGRITYPGDVVVRLRRAGPDFALANRGLRALDWLDGRHPGLAARWPFAYAGHYPDPFPAFYARERAGMAQGAQPASSVRAPPASGLLPLSPLDLWHPPRIAAVSLSPDGALLAQAVRENGRAWALDLVDLASGLRTRLASGGEPIGSLGWADDDVLLAGAGADAAREQVTLFDIRRRDGAPALADATRLPDAGHVLAAGYAADEILFERRGHDGRREVVALDIARRDGARRFHASLRGRLDDHADPGITWFADARGQVRAAARKHGDGTLALMYGEGTGLREVLPLRDEDGFRPLGLSADGALVYGLSDEGRAQRDLVALDPRTGTVARTLFSLPGADVVDVVLDACGAPVGASWRAQGRLLTRLFDVAGAPPVDLARAFPGRSVRVAGRSRDGRVLVLWVEASDQPPVLYRYDAASGAATVLDVASPWLQGRRYVAGTALDARARDGLPIEAFLTLPPGAGRRPLVVLPHGGPVGVGDTLGFNPEVQFLAALGYAVLQVNYRGSDGYGTAFRSAGYRAAGTAIEDDIAAALETALARYPLDPARMCIMGGSYGGYSALQSTLRWPGRFRCAVSISGITDRPLFFTASDSGNLAATRAELERVVGDPRNELPAMLATSPLYRYRDLTTPLMLVHGREDARVDFEHARRLVRMLNLAGRPPVLLAFDGEGHGWDRLEHVDQAYRGIAGFLRSQLGEEGAAH